MSYEHCVTVSAHFCPCMAGAHASGPSRVGCFGTGAVDDDKMDCRVLVDLAFTGA